MDFIGAVTGAGGPSFVPVAERIAVFDHDGTLIVERPSLVQFAFIYQRVRILAAEHPEWKATEPFQSVLEGDVKKLASMSFSQRAPLIAAAQANISQDEFGAAVEAFLSRGRHPRFDRLYTGLVYQPMLELIDYLHKKEFRVFIVSGGGTEFIRTLSEAIYGIPKERVIGSSVKTELREVGGRLVIHRKAGVQSINGGRFKPLNIRLHVGRRPILAVGNSDGDLQMLAYTAGSPRSLVLLVHHDDPDREYRYEGDSVRIRAMARERDWPAVSIARDFGIVFPVEIP